MREQRIYSAGSGIGLAAAAAALLARAAGGDVFAPTHQRIADIRRLIRPLKAKKRKPQRRGKGSAHAKRMTARGGNRARAS